MTNVYELLPQERRYDEASVWIAKLDKQVSAEDRNALQEWMAASPENEAVLLQMAELWDKLDTLSRLSTLFPKSTPRQPRLPRFAPAIAALILLVAVVGLWSLFELDFMGREVAVAAVSEGVYQTAVGERSTVTLPDGSQITLNTNSLIRASYTAQHRLLTLERGEVNVRVARDKARPLSVIVGGNVVQAVGTRFNIEITQDHKIELVVTEGKVKVGVHQRSQKDVKKIMIPAELPASATMVVAGEELILGSPQETVTEVSPEDIEVKLSWQKGNLIFRGESLEEAVKEVGRYTAVEFVLLDEKLKKVRVAGLFKADDIDGLLTTLRENFDIVSQRVDDQKILLSIE